MALRTLLSTAAATLLLTTATAFSTFRSNNYRINKEFSALRTKAGCTGSTYDYLQLEMQYPIALCADGVFSCTASNQWFTLHGLWAEDNNGDYPCYCTNEKFNENDVKDLLPQLNMYWGSLNGPADTFWAHEYEKHGTCEEDLFATQHDFFAGALNLLGKYNVTTAVAQSGIVPSNSKAFSLSAFKKAFNTVYGADPIVGCNSKGNIETVLVCVDKNLEIMECPSNQKDTCTANRLYLLASM